MLFSASGAFLEQYWLLYLLMLAMVLALNVCAKQSGDKSLHFSFALSACSLIASIPMLPFALLGFMKVGGSLNNTSHSLQPVFFGLVMASLGFVEIAKKVGGQWNVAAQSVLCVGLVLIGIAAVSSRQVLHWRFDIFSAPMLTAYKESKSDNVWFPEFPLSSLLATGHLYHFSYALCDRYLAGRHVSTAQILEGIPTPPFKLKYLEASKSQANLVPEYLGLSDDTISHRKKTGPWIEIIVQDLPLLRAQTLRSGVLTCRPQQ